MVAASREAAEEIALALTVTGYAAEVQAELAADLVGRLPVAFGELAAGRADLARVKVLAEATQFLSDEDAGKVDALLSPQLGDLTTGALRDKARRAIIRIDPAAAERRRERAERKARLAVYGNEDQTATVAVERMPAQLAAAAKARVNAIARAAKAAGMAGPLALLEAKVATGLLLDTLPLIPPPADGGGTDPSGTDPSGTDPGYGRQRPRPPRTAWRKSGRWQRSGGGMGWRVARRLAGHVGSSSGRGRRRKWPGRPGKHRRGLPGGTGRACGWSGPETQTTATPSRWPANLQPSPANRTTVAMSVTWMTIPRHTAARCRGRRSRSGPGRAAQDARGSRRGCGRRRAAGSGSACRGGPWPA